MLHPGLATNPYALTAIVCTATFLVAPVTLTVYKYAAFLMLITFHSLILCQYKCAPTSWLAIHVLLNLLTLPKGQILHVRKPIGSRSIGLLDCMRIQGREFWASWHILCISTLLPQANRVSSAAVWGIA